LSDITYTSLAKINLYLDVLGLRPDGYHEVLTVLEPIYLCDRMILREIPRGIRITSDHPGVPAGRENIVYRAVELLRAETGNRRGLSIHIEKRIPVAAGLGGGSGNSAATLLKLNQFWSLKLPPEKLRELSRRLGSDVPFFLNPRTSLCQGRGEIITPLTPAPPFWVVLLNPGVPVPTVRAYKWMDQKKGRVGPSVNRVLEALRRKSLSALGRSVYNAFQEVVPDHLPQVKGLLEFFHSRNVVTSILAGSGPTVAGLLKTEEQARALAGEAERVLPSGYSVAIASNTRS
jgi:4-diphosphocytidyl-2-C-methyl-D-erythritol kinase